MTENSTAKGLSLGCLAGIGVFLVVSLLVVAVMCGGYAFYARRTAVAREAARAAEARTQAQIKAQQEAQERLEKQNERKSLEHPLIPIERPEQDDTPDDQARSAQELPCFVVPSPPIERSARSLEHTWTCALIRCWQSSS